MKRKITFLLALIMILSCTLALSSCLGSSETDTEKEENENEVLLTFDANGGQITNGRKAMITSKGSLFRLVPEVMRPGYKFVCWTNEQGVEISVPFTAPDKDSTFYACWEKEAPAETDTDVSTETETEEDEFEVESTDGLEYYLLDDRTYAVSVGTASMLKEIVISPVYKGFAVSQIMAEGFSGAKNLEKITIPKSIKTIGSKAFLGCTSLKTVIIGDGICNIENSVFDDCTSLEYNEYENGLYLGNSINPYVLLVKAKSKDVTEIKVNEGTKVISGYAFSGCTSLTRVEIPNGVTDIGVYAFRNCESLLEASIPDTVTNIGFYVFENCKSLKSVTLGEGITNIEEYLFSGCKSLESVTISGNVTRIRTGAFSNCGGLRSIIIPSSVKSISEGAFNNCTKLCEVYNLSELDVSSYFSGARAIHTSLDVESIIRVENEFVFAVVSDSEIYLIDYEGDSEELILPDGYNGNSYEICKNAFSDCSGVTKLIIPSSITKVDEKAFALCDQIVEAEVPASVIPSVSTASLQKIVITSGTEIPKSAFYDCKALASATLPDGISTIGDYAFYGCEALTYIELPNSVITIGSRAFLNCFGLKEVELSTGLTTILSKAFHGCNNLLGVVIPSSVTTIESNAFDYCNAMLYCEAAEKPIGWSDDWRPTEKKEDGVIYRDVMWGIKGRFKTDNGILYTTSSNNEAIIIGNSDIKGDLIIPNEINSLKVTAIGKRAFFKNKELTGVEIPSNIKVIGNDAFSGCAGLTKIKFGATLMNDLATQNNVFYKAGEEASGTTVIIGEGVERIPAYLFDKSLANITSVMFENNSACKSIGSYAFGGCTGIERIELPYGLEVIEGYAFSDCTSLVDMVIPYSVSVIKNYAFWHCENIEIYCDALKAPNGWETYWNVYYYTFNKLDGKTYYSYLDIVWGFAVN